MHKFLVLFAAVVLAGMFSAQVTQVQAVVIKGTDCVCNGESFFQASNICSELSRLAKADGVLASSDNFKQIAISGANISQILGFYKSCSPKPTFLVSDGAGIDLMNGNCTDENCSVIKSCKSTLLQYLDAMKTGGTKKLLWMIYPDPQKSYAGTLKTNQDIWAKVVPEVMKTITVPKVLLVDLRPVWAGHYNEYTSDGIHATSAGGTATATAFWKAMKDSNFFDLGVAVQQSAIVKTAQSVVRGQTVSNNTVSLSLFLAQPASLTMRLTTVTGKTLAYASKQAQSAGFQNVKFPLGAIAPGVYCLDVQTGKISERSSLLVR
jgi:hypothetical protein